MQHNSLSDRIFIRKIFPGSRLRNNRIISSGKYRFNISFFQRKTKKREEIVVSHKRGHSKVNYIMKSHPNIIVLLHQLYIQFCAKVI